MDLGTGLLIVATLSIAYVRRMVKMGEAA